MLRENPVLVVIVDQIGESATKVVALDVLGERKAAKQGIDLSQEGAIDSSVEQKTGQRLLGASIEESAFGMEEMIEDFFVGAGEQYSNLG